MSINEKSWEQSLRESHGEALSYDGRRSGDFDRKKSCSRSPQKNTESKDYNPMDIYKRTEKVNEDSYIIADPFKPTLNKWMRKKHLDIGDEVRDEINKRNDEIRKIM